MQFGTRYRRKATINIISLVDVVFLLLIFFTDRAIRSDFLQELIMEELRAGKESRLTIKADRGVVHGKVVEVMDIARRSGIEVITIGTQIPTQNASP